MFDNEILKPINECKYTSVEKPCKSPVKEVKIYKDDRNKVRLVYIDAFGAISGLLIEKEYQTKYYTVQGVYTLPEFRKQAIAKSLLAIARIVFKDVRHSDYLTEDGKKFAKVVD